MDPRHDAFGRLIAHLQDLLSNLGGGGVDSLAGAEHPWAHCTEAFAEIQAIDRELGSAAHPYPPDVLPLAEQAVRLYALAKGLVARLQEDVGAERKRLTRARAKLESLTGEARTGHSCDIAG